MLGDTSADLCGCVSLVATCLHISKWEVQPPPSLDSPWLGSSKIKNEYWDRAGGVGNIIYTSNCSSTRTLVKGAHERPQDPKRPHYEIPLKDDREGPLGLPVKEAL